MISERKYFKKKKRNVSTPDSRHFFINDQKCRKILELFEMDIPIRHIVRQVQIAERTIRRLRSQYVFSGTVRPIQIHLRKKGMNEQDIRDNITAKKLVQKLLRENCAHTIGSLKKALEEKGIYRQHTMLYRYLHQMKYSRKKIRQVQLERNTKEKLLYRQKYCEMITGIPIENQVFLDETSFYQQTSKQFGWAPRGQSAYIHISANKKRHVNLLAAISIRGFEATKIVVGKFRCKHILEFIEHYLDHIQPNEVLILDNARYHHSVLVKEKLEQLGRPVRYLPAYSPQLNPIERVFGSIKRRYKKWRSLVEMSVPEMCDLIEKTVQDVSKKDFAQYFIQYQEWVKKGVSGQLFV